MTRCNIRNGTQNEIKRHRGPQRARSNPRYGNLKGKKIKCKLCPHRNLLNPIILGSQQPGWAGLPWGGRCRSPWGGNLTPSPHATGPADLPGPGPMVGSSPSACRGAPGQVPAGGGGTLSPGARPVPAPPALSSPERCRPLAHPESCLPASPLQYPED